MSPETADQNELVLLHALAHATGCAVRLERDEQGRITAVNLAPVGSST